MSFVWHSERSWAYDQVDVGNVHLASPLMLAAAGGFQDLVLLLMAHRAAVDLRNKEGSTALTLARHYKHQQLVSLLEDSKKPTVFFGGGFWDMARQTTF